MTLEQRVEQLEKEVAELKKASVQPDVKEVSKELYQILKSAPMTCIKGKHSVPPEEFREILENAPVVNLNKTKIDTMAEPIQCIASRECGGNQY